MPGVSPPRLSQSATIGVPGPPNVVIVVAPPVNVLRVNHCLELHALSAHLTTPGVSVPLPSQSPTTGTSPGRPNEKTTLAGPVELELRRYQRRPRTTPAVLLPSPFQS